MEDDEIELYRWIEGKEIIVYILTKLGSKRYILDKVMIRNILENVLDEMNVVRCKGGEIKIKNLTMKE